MLQGGLAQSSIQADERSGARWTLEWMTLPDLVTTAAASLKTAKRLLDNVEHLGTANV